MGSLTVSDIQKQKDEYLEDILKQSTPCDSTIREYLNQAKDKSGQIPDDLSCAICFKLFYKPKMCKLCNNAIFCESCIKEW